MSFKFGDVRRSLKKKGFVEAQSRHHVYLHHYHKGRQTGPYTYVSHGKDREDVGPNIIGKMKKQLSLNSHRDVEDLVNCPMSEKQYVERLTKAKIIGDAMPATPGDKKPRPRGS